MESLLILYIVYTRKRFIMYEMKDEYLTGIEFIDAEHTKLFEIADELFAVMKNDFIHDKYDYILVVIKELKEYTQYHFSHEEDYMKSINYKKLLSHMVEHREFIEKLDNFDLESIDKNQQQTLFQLLEFLSDWLIHHICEKDKLISFNND